MSQEFGSLQNLMIGSAKGFEKPTVGMGATLVYWSDRHAATVIEVNKSGKTIKIQQDKAIRTDNLGISDTQDYTFERNPEGAIYEVTYRRDGRWKVKGGSTVVWVGKRDEYYDYSF